MSMCRVSSCVVGRGCLLQPVCSLGKAMLAFTMLHFVLQGQIYLLLQVALDFLLLHSSPLWWKGYLFRVLVLEGLVGLHQFSSAAQSCSILCNPMDCGTPGLSVHHQLPDFTQIHVHWVSDAIQPLILCRPLFFLPSIFPSIRVFSNESVLHIRPKYWSFSFSISPSNEYSGLISCRVDWFNLLAVQGTLNGLLQHHSSKASILWCCPTLTSIHDYWKNHSFD